VWSPSANLFFGAAEPSCGPLQQTFFFGAAAPLCAPPSTNALTLLGLCSAQMQALTLLILAPLPLKLEFDAVRSAMEREAKRAAKIEQKVGVLYTRPSVTVCHCASACKVNKSDHHNIFIKRCDTCRP